MNTKTMPAIMKIGLIRSLIPSDFLPAGSSESRGALLAHPVRKNSAVITQRNVHFRYRLGEDCMSVSFESLRAKFCLIREFWPSLERFTCHPLHHHDDQNLHRDAQNLHRDARNHFHDVHLCGDEICLFPLSLLKRLLM